MAKQNEQIAKQNDQIAMQNERLEKLERIALGLTQSQDLASLTP